MSGSATITIGQTIQLPLTVDGTLTSGPTYVNSASEVGQLTIDTPALNGAALKGLKAGVATITANGIGATQLSDFVTITVAPPLAKTLVLSVGTVSGP